jgi:hypothetical protein
MNNPLFDFEIEPNNKDICYKDLYEEFVSLRERIEATCDNLQSQINEIAKKQGNKRVCKKKELSPEKLAIQLHFEENKNNQEVINNIHSNMENIGYIVTKNQSIPINILKMECMKLYNSLTIEQKQRYFSNKHSD